MEEVNEDENEDERCGAKTRSGKPCQRRPLKYKGWLPYKPKKGRCHLHGGKSLKGYGHPNYKHGRYSRFIQNMWADSNARRAQEHKREMAINKALQHFVKIKGRKPNHKERLRILKNLKY